MWANAFIGLPCPRNAAGVRLADADESIAPSWPCDGSAVAPARRDAAHGNLALASGVSMGGMAILMTGALATVLGPPACAAIAGDSPEMP